MRAYLVDAFTDRAFRGNPAGVVLLDSPADAGWMQQVAAELRHSETAFVLRRGEDYELRWFTPAVEVDLCGHATLATTKVLTTLGNGRVDPDGIGAGPYRFHTRSGELIGRVAADGAITLDFPAWPASTTEQPSGLARALGRPPVATYRAASDLLVELPDEAAVATLAPDFDAIAVLPYRGVVVTAAADEPPPGAVRQADFVSRFFGAEAGIREDPVTGSAHCALAPFWSARLGRDRLVGAQLSARGGHVGVTVHGDRVELAGAAVIVLSGELLV